MVAALFPLAIGLGWQSPPTDGPISITPAKRSAPVDPASGAAIRVDAALVLIPANVTTSTGAPVTTLTRDDFRLFEDGAEQKITLFRQDDAPISIGLLFDASGSMRDKMRMACEAAAAFFRTANPEDEFFLVDFGNRPKVRAGFTPDSQQVFRQITGLRPFGRTSLLDAIDLALRQMRNARNARKALVIFSDGGDNFSRRTPGQIKNALLESDVQLYAMGIFDTSAHKHTPEERDGPKLLDELATHSGGQHYPVKLDDLPGISARISSQLRTEYLLGYSPADTVHDGKYHRVKVSLVTPESERQYHTSYRQGYYAPAQ